MKGLDFAGGRPGAKAIKAARYDFVVRYLTDGGTGLPGKLLLPAELTDYQVNNVKVCFMFETAADRALAGRIAGHDDARNGDLYLQSMGLAGQVIYFAVDFDSTPEQQNILNEYLYGAATYLGLGRVGGYGGFWPISRALDAGAIFWAEQTVGWSGGNLDHRRHITQTGEQVIVNGIPCDVLTAEQADFGQYPPPDGRTFVDFTTPWVDHYHDDKPDKGATLQLGDLISWSATHAAHAHEAVAQLRADLPGIIAEAVKNSTVHVTVDTKA
jgi:hypothetical protein